METVYRRRLPAAHSGLHALDYFNPGRVTSSPDDWHDRETARGRRARRRGYARAERVDRAFAAAERAAGGAR